MGYLGVSRDNKRVARKERGVSTKEDKKKEKKRKGVKSSLVLD
jgi:hypothetical protein